MIFPSSLNIDVKGKHWSAAGHLDKNRSTANRIEVWYCYWITHTEADGEETIRIISARKADKSERRIYAEAH